MKEEIKDRWVEALRSGKYKQGKRALKQGENFCCLGVLCDITKDEIGMEWIHDPGGDFMDGYPSLPPPSVRDYAGLHMGNPTIERTSLALMNDTGVEFSVIADLIEKHWEEL